MAIVTTVNKSGHEVSLRIDETTERGEALIESLRRAVKRESLVSIDVKYEDKAPAKKAAAAKKAAPAADEPAED